MVFPSRPRPWEDRHHDEYRQPENGPDSGGTEPVKLIETSGGWIYPTCLLRLDGGPGLVDPQPGRQPGGLGRAPEPVGACGEGVVEDLLAAGLDGPGGAVVDGGGGDRKSV